MRWMCLRSNDFLHNKALYLFRKKLYFTLITEAEVIRLLLYILSPIYHWESRYVQSGSIKLTLCKIGNKTLWWALQKIYFCGVLIMDYIYQFSSIIDVICLLLADMLHISPYYKVKRFQMRNVYCRLETNYLITPLL